MNINLRSTVAVAAVALSSFGLAGITYQTSYTFNMNGNAPNGIQDIMLLENFANGGALTWAFQVPGTGSTTVTNPFTYDSPVTSTLIVGITHDLPGDADGQLHMVLGMDPYAASLSENIAWGTLFRTTLEDSLIANIQLATSGQDWSIIQPGLDAVGAFGSGDATNGILDPSTNQPVSAWFATGGAFQIETWSGGQSIGSGSSTVTAVPEPSSIFGLGIAALGLVKRIKKSR